MKGEKVKKDFEAYRRMSTISQGNLKAQILKLHAEQDNDVETSLREERLQLSSFSFRLLQFCEGTFNVFEIGDKGVSRHRKTQQQIVNIKMIPTQ